MAHETTASRRTAHELMGDWVPSAWKSLALVMGALALGLAGAYVPEHAGLSDPGRTTLFILIVCAALWVTEAMPAFAVSLVAIGMEIILLGHPGNGDAANADDWQRYLATWGSPLIWLFFGGFVLAAAAERTGLDQWLATQTIGRFGRRPAILLLGLIATTAMLSMFISNTATATLMLAAMGPLLDSRRKSDNLTKALILGVAFGANIGGMGTVIGSPPNAIAAGALGKTSAPINFFQWMVYGVPPAMVLLLVAWVFLIFRYLGRRAFSPVKDLRMQATEPPVVPRSHQWIVALTFVFTIGMWMTSPLHGIPTTVVAFFPTCLFTATAVLTSEDIRRLPWDVLLLIAGGLSLGVAISDTGLATWIIDQIPLNGISPIAVVIAFGFLTVVLSNLMSNTAAANMIVPIALVAAGSLNPRMVVPIVLCASLAMCLPISTPPNAIVYGTRKISTGDLLAGGLLMGIVGPAIVTAWAICVDTFDLLP